MNRKKYKIFLVSLSMLLVIGACKKEEQKKAGNPVVTLINEINSAHFGDSLSFTAAVSDDEVPLSTLKAQLFFSEEMVSEQVIRTKEGGEYSGKLYVPYFANIPNGTATIKFVLQNINLTVSEHSIELPVSRPDYPYLNLITANEVFKMERRDLYEYEVEAQLPAKVKGYIQAPAFGTDGNEMTFGWESNSIVEGSTADIPFSNSSSGNYAIRFNSFDYEASPFIIAYAINGTVMDRLDDDHFQLDLSLSKEEVITIDGIDDVESWWIDEDFISLASPGSYSFLAQAGEYRITADFKLKYFKIEPLQDGEMASLKPDGTGAVWIIGEGVGKPSVLTNEVGWDTDKAIGLAPIGNKKYQLTLTAGATINVDNINFKFFYQKGWGGEFTSPGISTTSDVVFVGDGDNGRDSGNLGIAEDMALEEGKKYTFTLDLSDGNDKALLSVKEKK